MSESNTGAYVTLPLPAGPFSTVVADPPWSFKFSTRNSEAGNNGWRGGGDRHYPLMTLDEVCALDVPALTAPDCVLLLWVPNSQLRSGLAVMEAWGFEHKNVLTWVKHSKNDPTRPAFGMGYWARGATEQVLLGVKGSPKPQSRSEVTWFGSAPERHSAKPDVFYEVVERLAVGPYLELFARRTRPGWTCWGNEVETPCATPQEPVPTMTATTARPVIAAPSGTPSDVLSAATSGAAADQGALFGDAA